MKGLVLAGLGGLYFRPRILIAFSLMGFCAGLLLSVFEVVDMHGIQLGNGIVVSVVMYMFCYAQYGGNTNWSKVEMLMPLPTSQKVLSRYLVYACVFLLYVMVFATLIIVIYFVSAPIENLGVEIIDAVRFSIGYYFLIGAMMIPISERLQHKHRFHACMGYSLGIFAALPIWIPLSFAREHLGLMRQMADSIQIVLGLVLFVASYFVAVRVYLKKPFD